MKTKIIRALLTGITAMSVVALSGCALSIPGLETDSEDDDDEEEDDDKKGKKDKDTSGDKEEDEEPEGTGTLKDEIFGYFGSEYKDHLDKGGAEAELLHAGRYIAKCTDLDADAVYEAKWDEDSVDYVVDDHMGFIRLEGALGAFFTGTVEKESADEFVEELSENYDVSWEFRMSGGTAYYVSGDEYLHMELTDKKDGDRFAVLELACGEDEKISSKTTCWVMEECEGTISFSDIPSYFVFSSGAGGWSTDIEIAEDGSFTGTYHDSDMGDTGAGYQNGTVYICNFTGRFSELKATDDPYVYTMDLLELNIDDADKAGGEEIIDEIRYVYSSPYGFENADEFKLYLPGAPLSGMTDACLSWIFLDRDIFTELPDGYYVIYNVGGEEGFTAEGGDSIWYRMCRAVNGDAYVQFTPSYYMGSYLSFFPDDDSAATLALDVPWDGKSTEAVECGSSWNDDGSLFSVTIEPAEGEVAGELAYVINVKCITDPEFDFSLWGSEVPGEYSGIVYEVTD
ncbi:MAG: hypothetical protein K6C99_05690 [Lachnospiraceae bacterium]|nr:hypothetical protein [Lachnospiraceae bacterium]